jgi:hypothetical protein
VKVEERCFHDKAIRWPALEERQKVPQLGFIRHYARSPTLHLVSLSHPIKAHLQTQVKSLCSTRGKNKSRSTTMAFSGTQHPSNKSPFPQLRVQPNPPNPKEREKQLMIIRPKISRSVYKELRASSNNKLSPLKP